MKNPKCSLTEFIYALQELSAEEAIDEIASSGLSDTEIVSCIKQISENDTFKFKK